LPHEFYTELTTYLYKEIKNNNNQMKEIINKEYAYTIEIKKGSAGNPLIIVKFKKGSKNYWTEDHSWCPTLDELEFLYKTKKMMEKSL
jgi:hypothetical protein